MEKIVQSRHRIKTNTVSTFIKKKTLIPFQPHETIADEVEVVQK